MPPPTSAGSEAEWCGSRNGAAADQPAVGELAGQRVDHRDLERLGRLERRQDAGQARRQHRLAGAGRADHQQVVAAGRGDLERPLGALLALDVGRSGSRALARRPAARAASAPAGLKWLISDSSVGGARPAPRRRGPGRLAALAAGQIRPRPAAEAAMAAGSTPATARSSRRAPARPARCSPPAPRAGSTPIATSSPSAIGRSKWLPSFSRSAGARLTVMRCGGSARPERAQAPRAPARGSRPPPCRAARPRRRQAARRHLHLHVDLQHLDALEGHRADLRLHEPSDARRTIIERVGRR